VRARPGNDLATKPGRAPNSEGDRHSRSLKCSFGLIGEADLGRFIPNFSQFITMAGEEQWQSIDGYIDSRSFGAPDIAGFITDRMNQIPG
jgi:hypothetical protein